ncbi:hypothetical protein XH88_04505 [Bradyrhizobium sp. CCBAU 51627]|nr:hypothetical protein [Bradyrhizobium sp. CCBAU 51627]
MFAIVQISLVSPAAAAGKDVRTIGIKGRMTGPARPAAAPVRGGVLRQDLFDRADPNNLKSDWPSPPAQPGQY